MKKHIFIETIIESPYGSRSKWKCNCGEIPTSVFLGRVINNKDYFKSKTDCCEEYILKSILL